MSNYKVLGIEKEMIAAFEAYSKTDLQMLIDSEYFYLPYTSKRKNEQFYCNIMVCSCRHKDWWYKNLIGFQFFCRVDFHDRDSKTKEIKEFMGVKLTNSKEIKFRGFDPIDVIII